MVKSVFWLMIFFAVPVVALAEREVTLRDYTREIREQIRSRLADFFTHAHGEVTGTVVGSSADGIYLQEESDGLKVRCASRGFPEGTRLRVRGTPTLEGQRLVLNATETQVVGKTDLPVALRLDLRQAIDSPTNICNWVRVQLEGRVIGETDTGFAIEVEGIPVNVVTSDDFDFLFNCEYLHPQVRVSGVIETILAPASLLDSEEDVIGVKLVMSEADRAELLPDALYSLRRRQWLFGIAAAVIAGLLVIALAFVLLTVLRQRRRLLRSRAVMGERKRMADDLHDTIEQHLVGAKLLIALGKTEEAKSVLARAKSEIRDIVWGLKNDDMMRLTPAAMLRELVRDENTKGLCRVDQRLGEALPAHLDASRMRDLSLIVREAIGNAIKHGGARHIAIAADSLEGGGWKLRIANDGAPFDPQRAPGAKEGHFGLEGMRERARRLGATIAFVPRKEGMSVELEVKG